MKTAKIKTAFLPAAGMGTRLRPLTDVTPKPLLPVAGRPLITYAMDHLITVGIKRFIVNTHHLAEAYEQSFPSGQWRGIPIVFRYEPVLLDTAGGLKNIDDLLGHDESLLVYNADIMTNLPLEPLLEMHSGQQKEATLVLRSTGPLLNVDLGENGEICDMRGLLQCPGKKRSLFTGIYLIERRFFQRLTAGVIESVVPVFVRMLKEQPGSVGSIVIDDGRWCDIGTLAAYDNLLKQSPG